MCVWNAIPRHEPEYDEVNVEDFQELAEKIKTEISEYGISREAEEEEADSIPSCCLVLCLDWVFHKIIGCCDTDTDTKVDRFLESP